MQYRMQQLVQRRMFERCNSPQRRCIGVWMKFENMMIFSYPKYNSFIVPMNRYTNKSYFFSFSFTCLQTYSIPVSQCIKSESSPWRIVVPPIKINAIDFTLKDTDTTHACSLINNAILDWQCYISVAGISILYDRGYSYYRQSLLCAYILL